MSPTDDALTMIQDGGKLDAIADAYQAATEAGAA